MDINKVINKIIGNKKFGGKNDLDGDGIPNKKDCSPRNTMRQDNPVREMDRLGGNMARNNEQYLTRQYKRI